MITSDVLVAVLAVLIAMPFAQNSSERLVVAMLAMTAGLCAVPGRPAPTHEVSVLDHSDRQNPHCHCHSHSRSRSRSRSRDRHRNQVPCRDIGLDRIRDQGRARARRHGRDRVRLMGFAPLYGVPDLVARSSAFSSRCVPGLGGGRRAASVQRARVPVPAPGTTAMVPPTPPPPELALAPPVPCHHSPATRTARLPG